MKLKYRLILISSVSALVTCFPAYMATSCYGPPYEDDEERLMMFQADLPPVNRGLNTFYFTHGFTLDKGADDTTDRLKNAQEWQQYLGENIAIKDIMKVLYSSSPDDFLLNLRQGTLLKEFPANTFIKAITGERFKKALDYLAYAKQNEAAQVNNADPWETNADFSYNDISSNAGEGVGNSEYKRLFDIGKAGLEKCKEDNFLQERYAFQLIRLARFEGNTAEVLKLYKTYFKEPSASTILNAWSLVHYASALNGLGKSVEANYYLSHVFNLCDYKKHRATNGYDIALQKQTLAMAKNSQERAGIWTIAALRNPGRSLREMNEVAANDGQYLPLLITREINKLENWTFAPSTTHIPALYSENDDWSKKYEALEKWKKENPTLKPNEFYKLWAAKNLEKDKKYIADIKLFVKKNLTKIGDKAFVTLVLAYLANLEGNAQESAQYLSGMPASKDIKIEIQRNILEIVNILHTQDINISVVQDKIAKHLGFLENNRAQIDKADKVFSSIDLYLSRAFKEKKNIALSALLYDKSKLPKMDVSFYSTDYYGRIAFLDKYAQGKDVQLFLNIKNKKNKTGLEFYACKQKLAAEEAYWDIKGTIELRAGDLKNALESFKKVPVEYWVKQYEFFNYLHQDPISHNPHFATKTVWNIPVPIDKAKLVARTLQLIDIAESNKDANTKAAAYFDLGNFYYNTSYYGHAWMMQKYGKSYGDYNHEADEKLADYFLCQKAISFYEKAMNTATDKELSAKACFMLHVCGQNAYDTQNVVPFSYSDEPAPESKKYTNPYLKIFWEKYKDTDTYKIKECPAIKDFVKSL